MRKPSYPKYLTLAEQRLNSLSSIDPNLDLGNGISIAEFRILLQLCKDAYAMLNTILANLDGQRVIIKDLEKKVRDYSELFLIAIAYHHGKDSLEYVKAGGVRKMDKMRTRKQAPPTTESNQ